MRLNCRHQSMFQNKRKAMKARQGLPSENPHFIHKAKKSLRVAYFRPYFIMVGLLMSAAPTHVTRTKNVNQCRMSLAFPSGAKCVIARSGRFVLYVCTVWYHTMAVRETASTD